MNFTKDQLLTLMNTIDFATDNDASYEEYTILQSGSSDLEPIRDILYNQYITKGENSCSLSTTSSGKNPLRWASSP